MSWQDGEPQQSGGCAYVDVDGTWHTTSCETKLQGAVCGVSRGEYHPLGPRFAHVQVVRATSSILHSNRAPSPKGKLPGQLSSGLGRLVLDSLQGALLFFPHGGAVGPQGGAAALPER